MTASTSETILLALRDALAEALPLGVPLQRNTNPPVEIPRVGLVILRDGDPGEPEVLLSPLTYVYEHRAEVDLVVDLPPEERDAVFDALKRAVGAALAADRTLGGLCDYVMGEAPAPFIASIDGAEDWKAATIPVVLTYGSPDPLT